jgi:hypothetical protein
VNNNRFKIRMVVSLLSFITLVVLPVDNEKLEGWEVQAYSPEILEQLMELRSQQSLEEIKDIRHRWKILVTKAHSYIDEDPSSAVAQEIFKEWMHLANEEYQNYEALKIAKSIAYKNNQIPDSPFDQKLWDFLEKTAIYMYQNSLVE